MNQRKPMMVWPLLTIFLSLLFTLTANAQSLLFSMDGTNFPTRTTGGPVGSTWCIWSEGSISTSVNFPSSGTYQFRIRAYGDAAVGINPIMELRIDGQRIRRFTVRPARATYSVQAPVTAGSRRVEISFLNDYYANGEDRNLYVRNLQIYSQAAATPTTQTQILQLSDPTLSASPGQTISLSTRFNAVPMSAPHHVFIHFLDSSGNFIFNSDYIPSVATTQWSGLVTTQRNVTLPSNMAPGTYSIVSGLYLNTSPWTRAPLTAGNGVTADASFGYRVGTLTVNSAPAPAPEPTPVPAPAPAPAPTPTPSPLGTQVLRLANPNLSVQAGQSLTFTTQFNAAPMSANYAVFVHFVNANGANALGADYTPATPTMSWSGLVTSNRTVAVPSSLPAGTYSVRMGLYLPSPPWDRVPLAAGSGVTADAEFRYTVGTLTVTSAPSQNPDPSPSPSPSPGGGGIPQPGSLTALTPSGPIQLQSNRTYSGLRITNPNGRCITGSGVTNVRITNSEIGPCGNGTDSEQLGIGIYDSSNVTVDRNIIHDVATGLDAVRSTGIVFSHNYVYNIRGPFPSGQAVQFENIRGANSKVVCNIINNNEQAGTEDNISMWMSFGDPSSPIQIAYNRVRGGHSRTGSGIIAGDGNNSGNIDVHDNTVVNVNNAGIGVTSGVNIRVRNNRIYNNGPYTSVGLSVRNFYDRCDNVQITNNRVWAFDRVWNSTPQEWHFLNTGECSNITLSGNVFGDTSLSAAIFDEPYPQCE